MRHLGEKGNTGYDASELSNILPGYKFFSESRKTKRGGGVGVFVGDELAGDVEVGAGTGEVCFLEEVFEAIILKFPGLIQSESSSRTKDLILLVIYRQPGNNNTDMFA